MMSSTMIIALSLLWACSQDPENPESIQDADVPAKLVTSEDRVNQLEIRTDIKPKQLTIENIDNFAITLPKRSNRDVFISPLNQPQREMVKVVKNVLEHYALQGDDPWAMGHALLALGATEKTVTDQLIVDAIFEYAEIDNIHGVPYPMFPREKTKPQGTIPIAPHKDLMMKILIETGVSPDRKVIVKGTEFTVGDYYKASILRAYLNPQTNDSSYLSPNDMPWSVQGITSLIQPNQTWVSSSGMMGSADFFTQFIFAVLSQESTTLKKAMAAGADFKKDRTGIFQYTCGGSHLLQSAAYATARGFGNEQTRAELDIQIDLLFYRFPKELQIYDKIMKEQPEQKVRLLAQRLKFVGHFLESAQKMSLLELYKPNTLQIRLMQGAMDQLVLTIRALQQDGVYQSLYNLKANDPQLYRDILGDSAHALYAMYLFSGNRYITY